MTQRDPLLTQSLAQPRRRGGAKRLGAGVAVVSARSARPAFRPLPWNAEGPAYALARGRTTHAPEAERRAAPGSTELPRSPASRARAPRLAAWRRHAHPGPGGCRDPERPAFHMDLCQARRTRFDSVAAGPGRARGGGRGGRLEPGPAAATTRHTRMARVRHRAGRAARGGRARIFWRVQGQQPPGVLAGARRDCSTGL